MSTQPSFSVRDPALAAFLRVRGYRLLSIQPSGRGPEFHFQDRPERLDDLEVFIGDQDTVMSPRAFARALRVIRSAIATTPGICR